MHVVGLSAPCEVVVVVVGRVAVEVTDEFLPCDWRRKEAFGDEAMNESSIALTSDTNILVPIAHAGLGQLPDLPFALCDFEC